MSVPLNDLWPCILDQIKSAAGESRLRTDQNVHDLIFTFAKEEFPLWGRMMRAYEWQQIKSCVSKDYCPSFVIGFFLFRPFFLKPFFACFFIALSGGDYCFWQVQPNFFQDDSKHWDMQYDIPNFRKIRSLTRDRVQMAPGCRNVQRKAQEFA